MNRYMKTKQWLFAALTALLMAGCSTESDLTRLDEDVNPPVPEGMTRLSFEVKGVRTGSSYATTALTPEESQLKDMIVILFPQGAGGKPLPDDKATVLLKAKVGKTALGAPTAAVLIDKSVPEGTYYAVIVANTISCFAGAVDLSDEETFNNLAERTKGTTYKALFADRTLSRIMPYYSYREEFSVVDYGLAMKSLVTGIKVAALADRGDDIALTATMKRPMARFDIKNSAWESFTVTGYGARNIRLEGDLCPAPDDVPDWAHISILDLPRQNYNAARINQINNPTDHDNNPATPAVIDYRSAFYLCPGLATDGSVVEIYGDLEIGGKTMPLTVKLPLVTGTPPTTTPIAITANKRYKIELTLSQTNDDVVGNVVLDEGAWDEGDGTGTGGDNIEQKLPGEILDPSTGTTYTNVDATNGTFTAPDGATEFSFRLVATANTIKAADGADAGIITNVEGAATLAPSTTYKITMDATGSTGKLIEVGQDKDGKPVTVKTYTVNRKEKLAPVPPANVTGHTPILIENLWFVDPSPEGENNTAVSTTTKAAAMCPSGWRLPRVADLMLSDTPIVVDGDNSTDYPINKNLNLLTKLGTSAGFCIDASAVNPTINNWGIYINESEVYIGGELEYPVRCVQEVK